MNTEIEQHYAARAKELSEIRGRFTANVVRWLYSSSEIWSWEDRRRKGRDEDILPTSEGALYGCGFDAADQPIVLQQFENERIWDESRGGSRIKPLPGVWLEEFIAHNGDELEVTRFARGELELISRRRFEGHRLLEEESVRHGVYQRTVIKRTEANTKLIQTFNNKGQLYHEVIYGLHGEKSYFRVRRDGTRFQL